MQSTEDLRAEKAERITLIVNDAIATAIRLKTELYRLNRKRPRMCIRGNKLKAKRVIANKKILLLFQLVNHVGHSKLQLALILSQPIPKFPHGTNNNQHATAIVGENAKETIIYKPNNTPGKQE